MSKNWKGMSSATGTAIEDDEHLRQSVADILMTPVGSRVMRRDYGSAIFELLDQPDNKVTQLRLMSAACIAITQWEPRLTPTQITTESVGQGSRIMKVTARRNDTLSTVTTDITLTEGS